MSKRKAAEDTAMGKTQMDVDGEDSSDDDTPIVNIEWDFNGLNPEVDFHGLKSLIKQLYGVDHELVELSALTDLILSQAEHVGTAVKCDGEENDPFAFISVLGVNQHNENDAIKSLLAYLRARLSTNQQISNILQLRPDVKLGLLFSERLINMPHQVVPPMYEMLEKELNLGGPDFAFTHLLIISRTYTEVQSALDAEDDRPQKKQKAKKQAELMYFHAEDEVLRKHALADEGFEYQKANDAGLSDSRRAFQEMGYKPQGHAILLDASKLATVVQAITEYFGSD